MRKLVWHAAGKWWEYLAGSILLFCGVCVAFTFTVLGVILLGGFYDFAEYIAGIVLVIWAMLTSLVIGFDLCFGRK